MQKEDKARVVAELTERLKSADTLIVADYRGLTMSQIDDLRGKLLEHGARFTVVKNTLTRRAAKDAGADALLALLEGPSAIAFIEAEGDMVAVAKALADSARDTKVLAIRGGILAGKEISADDVDELSKLPPLEILRGRVLGAGVAPLHRRLARGNAPRKNWSGLIAPGREQLGGEETAEAPAETPQEEQPQATAETADEGTDNETTSQIAEGDLATEEENTDGGS